MNQVPDQLPWLMQTAAAQESSNLLLLVDIILLVVEGVFLIPLALAYMSWVRRACAKDRASLYSIFLRVPRPTVVAIAKAEVKLVGEDADDNDDPAVCTATCGAATSLALPICPPQSCACLLGACCKICGSCDGPVHRVESVQLDSQPCTAAF